MFYLLHGNDEFTCREQLKKLRQQGDFAYNQDRYIGGEVSLATLTATCNTFPFLSEQRLVILEGLPKKRRGEDASTSSSANAGEESPEKPAKGRKKRGGKSGTESRAGFEKGLAEAVSGLPETTVLIVLVDEELAASSPLLKAAQDHGKIIQSTLPKGAALESWIKKRAQESGVKISGEAVSLLADFIGNQLRLLANEIDKLATYIGPGKTIEGEHVRLLSAEVQESRVFDLTDALAQRNRTKALNLLHDLMADGLHPLALLPTITSQVRNLLLVKELAANGLRTAQIASAIGSPPFVVEKSLRNIGKFSTTQLENTYRRLLETDAALKRSRLSPEMALDLLVVQFGH
ncbi:MAG TPA: DNA polymerase III subunit delta [Ktedonobacteraceae bacterium]|nr:DNA polymerase III subunit delta [Ktedonobacteraceae bacterium]